MKKILGAFFALAFVAGTTFGTPVNAQADTVVDILKSDCEGQKRALEQKALRDMMVEAMNKTYNPKPLNDALDNGCLDELAGIYKGLETAVAGTDITSQVLVQAIQEVAESAMETAIETACQVAKSEVESYTSPTKSFVESWNPNNFERYGKSIANDKISEAIRASASYERPRISYVHADSLVSNLKSRITFSR